MTRSVEDRHPGESWLLFWLGNATALPDEWIRSVAVAWIFKEGGKWNLIPRFCSTASLFYNAQFFVRLAFPLGMFIGLRLGTTYLFQCSIGWKLIGRLNLNPIGVLLIPALWYLFNFWSWWLLASLVLYRIQTDASAAAGVTGPNYGQATGYDFGTH